MDLRFCFVSRMLDDVRDLYHAIMRTLERPQVLHLSLIGSFAILESAYQEYRVRFSKFTSDIIIELRTELTNYIESLVASGERKPFFESFVCIAIEACSVRLGELKEVTAFIRYSKLRQLLLDIRRPQPVKFPDESDFFTSKECETLLFGKLPTRTSKCLHWQSDFDPASLAGEIIAPITPIARKIVGLTLAHLLYHEHARPAYFFRELILNADLYFGDCVFINNFQCVNRIGETFVGCAETILYKILKDHPGKPCASRINKIVGGFGNSLSKYCFNVDQTAGLRASPEWFMQCNTKRIKISSHYVDFFLDAIILNEEAVAVDKITLGMDIERMIKRLRSGLIASNEQCLRYLDMACLERLLGSSAEIMKSIKKATHWKAFQKDWMIIALSVGHMPHVSTEDGEHFRLKTLRSHILSYRQNELKTTQLRSLLSDKHIKNSRIFDNLRVGKIEYAIDPIEERSGSLRFLCDTSIHPDPPIFSYEHIVKILYLLHPTRDSLDVGTIMALISNSDKNTILTVRVDSVPDEGPVDLYHLKSAVCGRILADIMDRLFDAKQFTIFVEIFCHILDQCRELALRPTLVSRSELTKRLVHFAVLMGWNPTWKSVTFMGKSVLEIDADEQRYKQSNLNHCIDTRLHPLITSSSGPLGKANKENAPLVSQTTVPRTEPSLRSSLEKEFSKTFEVQKHLQKRFKVLIHDLMSMIKHLKDAGKSGRFVTQANTCQLSFIQDAHLIAESSYALSRLVDSETFSEWSLPWKIQNPEESVEEFYERLSEIYAREETTGTPVFLDGLIDRDIRYQILNSHTRDVDDLSLGEALVAVQFLRARRMQVKIFGNVVQHACL